MTYNLLFIFYFLQSIPFSPPALSSAGGFCLLLLLSHVTLLYINCRTRWIIASVFICLPPSALLVGDFFDFLIVSVKYFTLPYSLFCYTYLCHSLFESFFKIKEVYSPTSFFYTQKSDAKSLPNIAALLDLLFTVAKKAKPKLLT